MRQLLILLAVAGLAGGAWADGIVIPTVTQAAQISGLQTATGVLHTAVSALQSATGSLHTAVSALQAATGVLDSAVSDLQSSTGAIHDAVSDVFGSLSLETAGVSDTQATITVTCKDAYGNTLAAAKTFTFWFTTAAVQTVPSTNGIESFTFVAHGNVDAYLNLDTCPQYIGTTHTDGTMDFLVTADAGPWTNRFFAMSPNGALAQTAVVYEAPE